MKGTLLRVFSLKNCQIAKQKKKQNSQFMRCHCKTKIKSRLGEFYQVETLFRNFQLPWKFWGHEPGEWVMENKPGNTDWGGPF